MKKRPFIFLPELGFTLAEMCIASAVAGILLVMVHAFIGSSLRNTSKTEAATRVRLAAYQASHRIKSNLDLATRMFAFPNDSWRARADLSGCPPRATGNRLPTTGAELLCNPIVGNELFVFIDAGWESVSVGTTTYRVRTGRFIYYYPGTFPGTILKQPRTGLMEWKSKRYADHYYLTQNTAQAQAVGAVLFQRGVIGAVMVTASNPATAFFDISADGSLSLNAAHVIPRESCTNLLDPGGNTTVGGFRLGLCPTTTPSMGLRHAVPGTQTILTTGIIGYSISLTLHPNPNGLEIVIYKPFQNLYVSVRIVAVAEGSFNGAISEEKILVTNVEEHW